MIEYPLSQKARNLALYYGNQQFLDYVLNVFIPRMLSSSSSGRGRFLLRTDFPDRDRNIVNTAWGQYRRTL